METKIKELKVGMNKVDVVGKIKEIGNAVEFESNGKKARVANAIIKDDSGEIKLIIFNDDIDNMKVGNKIKIIGGYTLEYSNELRLYISKYGRRYEVLK